MGGSEFIRPDFDNSDKLHINPIPPGSYLLDDGMGGNAGYATTKCSKSCCSAQWPTPFNLKYEKDICNSQEEYEPNNMYCNNAWEDSGCLCLDKKQYNYLADRGGNAN